MDEVVAEETFVMPPPLECSIRCYERLWQNCQILNDERERSTVESLDCFCVKMASSFFFWMMCCLDVLVC